MASVHQHPAWFGSVMGTGATSVVLVLQSEVWDLPWLAWVAVAFLLLASLLAILLWPRYGRRLVRRSELMHELGDPGHGSMLATLPAGFLVLAVAWARVGPEFLPVTAAVWVDIVLAGIGVVLALGLGIAWAHAIASGTHDLAAINGGWLIPPVMNLIVPLALVPVMLESTAAGTAARPLPMTGTDGQVGWARADAVAIVPPGAGARGDVVELVDVYGRDLPALP